LPVPFNAFIGGIACGILGIELIQGVNMIFPHPAEQLARAFAGDGVLKLRKGNVQIAGGIRRGQPRRFDDNLRFRLFVIQYSYFPHFV
jgi:hypothetical protein